MVMILHMLILFMNIMKIDIAKGHTTRCAYALLFLHLFFLFACGCSVRSGGAGAPGDATTIEGLNSRAQDSYEQGSKEGDPSKYRVKTDTTGETETPAMAPVQGPIPLGPEKPYAETITLNIQFDTNEYVVKDLYFGELARFARVLKSHPDLYITIEGHTDNTGHAGSNLELSRKRAGSVKGHLVSQGVDASRIAVQGYGESRPIAGNGTEEGKRKNRRVEATVEYEKAVFLKKKTKTSPPASPSPLL